MPRYLAIASLNEEGASALLGQGFSARTAQFRDLIESLGGTLDGYWFGSGGEIISVMSYAEPPNFALATLQGMASGTWLEHAQIKQIYDGSEMDAELATQATAYRPPGS